ncbi:MAG: ATP-dependent helicase HrpB [Alphaproteobacteria bacterium]|nr:ATP-dependent helicase HrpB [Alphaproteobacteria bacterium]
MPAPFQPPLPIDAVLDALRDTLVAGPSAVLVAEPGAGKTTRVPLALLDAPWLAGGRIVMLEPRRLAARAAARRMAASLGEEVGDTVGFRVRGESKVSRATRIEVVTDGLYLRRLQRDPELDGIALVVFDEFHERGLETDLSLALTLDARNALRPELRVLVMSATLDAGAVAGLLDGAPIVRSQGRSFPVSHRYLGRPAMGERIDRAVANAVRRAMLEEPGSALVFLPGVGEIRRVAAELAPESIPTGTIVAPLYGDLPLDQQDAAIRPAPRGARKIVLATSIAETSLTIEGIRIVVDSGLARVPRFDPNTGMGRLETVRVSRASADQRAGRAGRLEPGVAFRLWGEAEHRALAAFAAPEIAEADLAGLVLELARWGVADPATLRWLDPPPAASLQQARAMLLALGAIDADNRITAHGQAMAELGLHPRLAHVLVAGRARGHGALACALASLIGERDPLRATGGGTRSADIRLRVDALRGDEDARGFDRGALANARKLARDLRRQLDIAADERTSSESVGELVALGWPDRLAQRRGAHGQFRLANGRGAFLPPEDPLAGQEFLAVADLDGGAKEARIFLAAPIDRATIESMFDAAIETREGVAWDPRTEAVEAARERRLGAIVLHRARIDEAPPALVVEAMLEGVRQLGLPALPWSAASTALRQRIAFLARHEPEAGWPAMDDAALLAALPEWLGPRLMGCTRRAHLERVDLHDALLARLDWPMRRRLDADAPTHVAVPSGSRIPVDYGDPDEPALAVRLQEMFGARESPRIAGGRVALTLRLLSPASRPLQVTRDLAGFWRGSYADVRREMRGRYPKHPWPDDPAAAVPTARAKPRGT